MDERVNQQLDDELNFIISEEDEAMLLDGIPEDETPQEDPPTEEDLIRDELTGKGYTKETFAQNRKNYLIEAGAGAGKTFIMVQRIINQLVTGYYDPEDIVAITFTNKSTLELRERLDEELRDRRETALKTIADAETAGDAAAKTDAQTLLQRLETLLKESGRMQVSTIHSFCQTMLEAMPFASPYGLDMRVLEEDDAFAESFFDRKMAEKSNTLFQAARDLGMPSKLFRSTFLECCKNNEAIVAHRAITDPVLQGWEQSVAGKLDALQKELHQSGIEGRYVQWDLRSAVELDPADFAKDQDARGKLLWNVLLKSIHLPLNSSLSSNDKNDFKASPSGQKMNELWFGNHAKELRKTAPMLYHSYLMEDVEKMLAAYRAEKQRLHIATYNDLLLRVRDMLKTKDYAREYFHRRYKVLYVDEMQDTDPVQTEMLFYLTADKDSFEKSRKAADWKLCRPVPGSLFLVGDPKQAIYRFRGADIGVYNDLLTLFKEKGTDPNAVGEKVTLRYNFRSAQEICDLADQVFAPAPNDPQPYHFVGGTYHAEYVPMEAKNRSCPHSRTVYYSPGFDPETDDPRRVAAFIRAMIDHKKQVGIHNPKFKRYAHAAEAKDFLILTQRKDQAQRYAAALKELGIAAELTGEKEFNKVEPVTRAVLHLRSLLSQRDDRLVLLVLKKCYGLSENEVRVFLQRTTDPAKGWRPSLSRMIDKSVLSGIRQALEAESPRDENLLAVCGALEEMAHLQMLARKNPAMSVIEELLESCRYGVWQEIEKADLAQRKKTYSEVQQYLNLVRKSEERSFAALAEYAIACADQTYEHELGLEPDDNAVRIMNLHKAKGLEGEVVILANGWYYQGKPLKNVERSNGQVREYIALREKVYGYDMSPRVDVAFPDGWDARQKEEQKYLTAEYARLLYVAATRAKTMLVVCDKERYDPDQEKKTSYWEPLLDGLEMDEPDSADPDFGEAFEALNTGNVIPVQIIDPNPAGGGQPKKPVIVQEDPKALEQALHAKGQGLAVDSIYPITPSRLDKEAPGKAHYPDPDDPDVMNVAADDRNDGDVPDMPVLTAQETKVPGIAETSGPYGKDWGTIVHRVMELAVRNGNYTETALYRFARQAVKEKLDQGIASDDLGMLGLTEMDDEKAVMDQLVPKIVMKTGFITNKASRLRQLLDGAESYPELPFFLQAKADDAACAELYQHLSAHISSEKAKNRALAVEGIIDLAVYRDGNWCVVDYKTDKRGKTESVDAFKARLKGEYTPQITAYARVLDRMGLGTVKEAYLCSIPLNGDLIELDI